MPFPAVHPALDRALAARGYAEPTSVQLAVIEADQNPDQPHADMLVSAQTGSGKTVAFGLAMASTLLGGAERFERSAKPLALVIAPTRELAIQIVREFEWLYAETGARIVQCVGGMSVRDEQRQLERGAHIVVGTPGRLCDHLDKDYLDLSELKIAVLDEADEMLDLGFREELETLLKATPESRRTMLFSATIARGIAMLAKNYQRDAIRIDTTSATEPHGDIEYRAMRVSPGDTERAVVNVLRYFEAGRALVFCHTREAVRHLYASLRERGFHAVGLSGEMGQRERNDALQALRDGHAKVCVATDVAARGLDLPDLGLVIHADIPSNKATLLHRSGRTGRAGKKGVSVLLVTHAKRRRTEQVFQSANIEAIWSAPPSADDIRAQDRQRLLEHPALTAAVSSDDQNLAKQLAERVTAEQLAGALIGLLRADLPEPEDVGDDVRMRDTQAREPRERALPRTREEKGFASDGDGVWFRLNVGRERKADPKWILPLVCRVGNITRNEIGPIRIFADETKFEIVGHAAEAFAKAIRENPDAQVEIEPSSPPGPKDMTHPARARREDGVRADRAPREKRDFGDRPPREKREYADRKPPARDDARANRYKQRDEERAAMPAAAQATSDAARALPPHIHPSGLNRKQRRDAARANGELTSIVSDTVQAEPAREIAPKRSWTPEADARPARAPRSYADRPAGDRPVRDHKEGFKSRGPKPEGFAPRGPRKDGDKPFRAAGSKPAGKSFKPRGDKPFRAENPNKPFRAAGDKPFRAGGKPGGKPFRGKR
jgi:ATP-dependent RNA helicase DeaD